MASNEIDLIDIGALIILPAASSFVLGVFSFSLDIFGGYDFGAPLWSVGGANISLALILTVASVAWIVGTNMLDESDYDQYTYGAMVFSFALPLLFVFVPTIQTLMTSSDIILAVAWIGITVASILVSYKG